MSTTESETEAPETQTTAGEALTEAPSPTVETAPTSSNELTDSNKNDSSTSKEGPKSTTDDQSASTENSKSSKDASKKEFKGKRVVIVGASSGIGAELARQYSAKKNKVALAARRMDRLEQVASECKERGAADTLCVRTDALNLEDCKNLMDSVANKWGGIDIVIYNAGQAMHVKFADITNLPAVRDKIMGVNFDGAVNTAYYAQTYLKESKGQVVAVSSVAGEISPPFLTFYAAAKHAIHGFFEALRNEEPGYAVTIVCPGYVATEIDDKKIVGDGTSQSVELNVDKSKYMSVQKAAQLIIGAVAAKKKKYHLTYQGSLGTTFHALMPESIDAAVRKEMKKITQKSKK